MWVAPMKNFKSKILLTPVGCHLLDWIIELLRNKTYWQFTNVFIYLFTQYHLEETFTATTAWHFILMLVTDCFCQHLSQVRQCFRVSYRLEAPLLQRNNQPNTYFCPFCAVYMPIIFKNNTKTLYSFYER